MEISGFHPGGKFRVPHFPHVTKKRYKKLLITNKLCTNLTMWKLYIEIRHVGLREKLISLYLITWRLKHKTMKLLISQLRCLGLLIISKIWQLYLNKLVLKKTRLLFSQFWYLSLMEDHIHITKRKRCWKCFSLRNNDIRAKQNIFTCFIHLELFDWV